MNWKQIKSQVEYILSTVVRFEKLTLSKWNSYLKQSDHAEELKSVNVNHDVYFYLYSEDETIHTLAVEETAITTAERQLLELMIEACRGQGNKNGQPADAEEEFKTKALKDWIHSQLEKDVSNKELPEIFASQLELYSNKIPFLLYGDYADNRTVKHADLKKLLETFFEVDEIILVPLLDKEWLILGTEAWLEGEEGEEAESMENSLESICSGLYEMMVSEGIGECHLSVHYPMIPSKSLLSSVILLRQAIALGRAYHVGRNIHLPWELHLEKVLNSLPDVEKKKMTESILKRNDYVLDVETLTTLEKFFELDCNVSETARKLFIHRNTLLYRLDKFKQETGLDARTFSDAILVNMFLLLYKVTKRK